MKVYELIEKLNTLPFDAELEIPYINRYGEWERNTKNISIDYDWKENIFILEGE